MKHKGGLAVWSWWLLFIGGVNLGLTGLGDFAGGDWNVIHLVLGQWPQFVSLVYVLIGLSAVYLVFTCKGE